MGSSVPLNTIRSFVGVIKDISENYVVDHNGDKNTPNRFTDVGCIFSANAFTLEAQEYAWAHNIFLISLSGLPTLKPLLDEIRTFVDRYDQSQLKNNTKKQIIESFWLNIKNQSDNPDKSLTLTVGIIDGIYPVALVANGNWLQIINEDSITNEILIAEKTGRRTRRWDTTFHFNLLGLDIQFSVPNGLAKKIIERIEGEKTEASIFRIDVPYKKRILDHLVRRFITIDVYLPEPNKNEYIKILKKSSLEQ